MDLHALRGNDRRIKPWYYAQAKLRIWNPDSYETQEVRDAATWILSRLNAGVEDITQASLVLLATSPHRAMNPTRRPLIVVLLALVGCTPPVWDRPDTTQAMFEMDTANCQLVARAVTPNVGSGYQHGSLASAAGAGIADGIMLGIEHAENYQLCMKAHGYTRVR